MYVRTLCIVYIYSAHLGERDLYRHALQQKNNVYTLCYVFFLTTRITVNRLEVNALSYTYF